MNKAHKTPEQALVLEKEYLNDPFWPKHKIYSLAKKLELKPYQVYKWNWDRNEAKLKNFLQGPERMDESPIKVFKISKNESLEKGPLC